MKKLYVYLLIGGFALVGAPAHATLIQENFDSLPVQSGIPAGWFEGYDGPGASWEVIDDNGNHLLKAVSGPSSGGGDAQGGPDNGTGWFVENFDMQVSLNIQSGSGGGIGVGQFENGTYVGNAYYVEVNTYFGGVGLFEEGLSAGTSQLQPIYPFAVTYNTWYDLRLVSTGTSFQVWFRPHSTNPWQASEKIFDVAQDYLHPGHKSYVEGLAGCYAQNGNGPSTVLFDDFRLEALPFVSRSTFTDNFEDSVASQQLWELGNATETFPALGGSQAVQITSPGGVGGLGLDQGGLFYSHAFTLQTSIYVDGFHGGIFWASDLSSSSAFTDYHLTVVGSTSGVDLALVEEQNSTSGTDETLLAQYTAAGAVPAWYKVQVTADYRRYRIWFWPAADAQPASPVIDIPQDLGHPGYRLILLGGVGLWVDNNQTGIFDDFYFDGLEAPTQNTPSGTDVTVQPDSNIDLTFSDISSGGTTTVETSTTAPSGGPGGLEFQGTYYDITTTAVHDGPVTICFSYDDTGMTLTEEQNLRLMHWDAFNSVWEDITTSVDTTNNVVCGETTSFSVFGLAVVPSVEGFLQPVNMPPDTMSVFKGRSTIPLKFRLTDPATGEPVTDATATVWGVKVAEGVPGDVNEALESTQPDGGDTFRYSNGQYIYNLSTKNLDPGVYRIHARILEGLIDLWVDVAVK